MLPWNRVVTSSMSMCQTSCQDVLLALTVCPTWRDITQTVGSFHYICLSRKKGEPHSGTKFLVLMAFTRIVPV
jgi:hypothetical protein